MISSLAFLTNSKSSFISSSSYDIVVVACGPGILNLCPQLNKELRLVRGQNLFYDPSNNNSMNSVDMNIGYLSGEYIIPGVVAVVVDVITINIFIDSYADIIIIICCGYV